MDTVEIVGVRFKRVGKIYYFDPKGYTLKKGENVIVETVRGTEIGEVAIPNRTVEPNDRFMPLSPVVRPATPEDLKEEEKNHEKEKTAFKICEEKIAKHGLPMSLVDVEYTFDNNKIIFAFVADGRIDFRELVKDLASVFKTRIELRQIGVRDETKAIGALGMCGRRVCCASFLSEFVPVSVKMAKDQALSTNPQKISGACGKLICCLNFEETAYEDAYKTMPKVGYVVATPDGQGVVTESNILTDTVHVKLDKPDGGIKPYKKDDVKVVKGVEAQPEAASDNSDEVADIPEE